LLWAPSKSNGAADPYAVGATPRSLFLTSPRVGCVLCVECTPTSPADASPRNAPTWPLAKGTAAAPKAPF